MLIGGFQKLTLIDYPGKLATTVFTVGCSFRCPFCHNPELVSEIKPLNYESQEKEFFAHLKKRKGKLEGVCITGGEPTIQPDIVDFIKKVKKMGYLVKLDSNGTRPDVLKKIFDAKLVDFVAMDIKNSPKKYSVTTGTKDADLDRINLSIDLIRNSGVPHEFRTTVVPGLHTEKDFIEIGKWLEGAPQSLSEKSLSSRNCQISSEKLENRGSATHRVSQQGLKVSQPEFDDCSRKWTSRTGSRYYLQKYREEVILDPRLKKKTKGKRLDLQKIQKSLTPYFGEVIVRE